MPILTAVTRSNCCSVVLSAFRLKCYEQGFSPEQSITTGANELLTQLITSFYSKFRSSSSMTHAHTHNDKIQRWNILLKRNTDDSLHINRLLFVS